MRQFITWQFWLSVLLLAAMFAGLVWFTRSDSGGQDAATIAAPAEGDDVTKDEQPIDLIVLVFQAQADEGFDFVDGKSTERVMILIDGYRYMDIPAGTPGENRCGELDQLARCVVAADVLGDAVLWFSFLPLEPRNVVTLPPIEEIRDGGFVELTNGWVVTRAATIRRECDTDTTSLSDFLERFPEEHTTTYSIEQQRITTVTCTASAG